VAVYTAVTAEAMAALLERYDVGTLVSAKGIAEGVENTNYLVDTTTGRFILTLYEKRVETAELPFFLALTDHLAGAGLPVPRAVRDRENFQLQTVAGRPACLIEFLPGVSVSSPTAEQAAAAGAALARMHRAVRTFDRTRRNTMGFPAWKPLLERCGRDLDQIMPGFYDDLAFAIGDLSASWPGDALDQCIVHADLFPDNVLMRGDTVGGLIDFYFACTDARLYDLAVMHTAWSFDATGTRHNAAVGQALIDSYAYCFPIGNDEQAAWRDLAVGACVRFTLSRAWDWLNTPRDALVTRKDPLAFWRRIKVYDPDLARRLPTLR
jgi:homoserine kinase type II